VPELLNHIVITEPDAADINIDRTFNPSASTLLHSAPVFEAPFSKLMSRNNGDCFIPVLYRYRVKSDINNITICTILRYFNPVPFMHKIISRDLNSRNKGENCIPENKQQNSCQCTDTSQYCPGRFFCNQSGNKNNTDQDNNNIGYLEITLNRPFSWDRQCFIETVKTIEQCGYCQKDNQYHKNFTGQWNKIFIWLRKCNQISWCIDDKHRNKISQPAQGFAFNQVIINSCFAFSGNTFNQMNQKFSDK